MAEYKDIEQIKKHPYFDELHNCTYVNPIYKSGINKVLQIIEEIPAADVVPRAEFEALADVARENIDSANERAERMRVESENLRILYENARNNVAKEIITIIEQRMKANIERMNGLKSNVWKVGYLTKNEAYQDIKEIIENKYTEDE